MLLSKIGVLDSDYIITKNIYNNTNIITYINHLENILHSKNKINLANLLLNNNELILNETGIVKTPNIGSARLYWSKHAVADFIKDIQYTDQYNYADTIKLPIDGSVLSFMNIIYYNRMKNKVLYIISPMMLLYELCMMRNENEIIEVPIYDFICTEDTDYIMKILNFLLRNPEKYLEFIHDNDTIYDLDYKLKLDLEKI